SVVQDTVEPTGHFVKYAVGSLIMSEFTVGGWRPDLPDSLTAVIFSYDEQFYDYYHSASNMDGPGALSGQTYGSFHWNVHGDGIGLFIGETVTQQRVASR
ncbi:MAG TPA: hypothetical protein VMM37_10295, partial [Bacteroidota bacterium]|nr:hypothetical protein [Bacteroidota bacterium]